MSIICFGIIKLITLKNTEKLTQYKQTVATLSPHLVENNLDFFCQQTSTNGRMWTVLPSRQSLPKKGQKTVEIFRQMRHIFHLSPRQIDSIILLELDSWSIWPALTLKFEILVFLPSISMITEAPLSFSLKL